MADFTIRHVIECPDLITAINGLADAVSACAGATLGPRPHSSPDQQESPAEATVEASAPCAEEPKTSPPTVSYKDIAMAGAVLLEAGKMDELIALLQSFGVDAITELNPSQYDAMAEGLRALGAEI